MAAAVQFGILALIVGAGLVGGFLIARHLRGVGAIAAWLLWLALPFVGLGLILLADSDPTLPQDRASYNFSFGFVLIGLILAVPWLPANLIGGLVGLRRRPAMPGQPAREGGALPDWRHPDDPQLTLAELGALMRTIAARAGVEERLLPQLGPIDEGAVADRWGAFIDADARGYAYCELERGGAMFDYRVVVADQLMYLVFRDKALAMAGNHLARYPTTPDRYTRLRDDKQQELLAAIDPRWGRQFALDRGA